MSDLLGAFSFEGSHEATNTLLRLCYYLHTNIGWYKLLNKSTGSCIETLKTKVFKLTNNFDYIVI